MIGYFVTFWSTTGQTLGSRVMRIRVTDALGAAKVTPLRAVVRVGGLVLATIPLFAGFWIMLWDDRRRCLQDRLARTTVVHAPPQARIVRQAIPRGPRLSPREVDGTHLTAESGGEVAPQVPTDDDGRERCGATAPAAPGRVIRVVLADDSYLVREAIAHVLDTEPGFELVATLRQRRGAARGGRGASSRTSC